MGKTKVALITVGQAPRVDMTDDLEAKLGPRIQIVQYGALDDYDHERIAAELAPVGDDEVLVSRMRDGSQATFSGRLVNPLVQARIDQAESEGAETVILACTGGFPEFRHAVPLVMPLPLFHTVAKALAGNRRIALMVPEESQRAQSAQRWLEDGIEVDTVAASPYGGIERIAEAARGLRGGDYPFIALDCMGFSSEMRRIIREESGLPVLLPRTLVASTVNELLG